MFFFLYYGKIALFKNKLLVQYIQKQYIENLLYKKNSSVQVKSRTSKSLKLIQQNLLALVTLEAGWEGAQ